MRSYYADLHIHIGRTEKGRPVKISGSKDLTFHRIAREASERKGLDMIGIIDCHSPSVQEEISTYLDRGEMTELAGGGIRYHRTSVILGSEIEVREEGMGPAHLLAFFSDFQTIREFTGWMRRHMKNVELSSQRIYVPARILQEEVVGRGGILIPAHIFTPHKSLYGSSADRMDSLLNPQLVAAVELGLSADSEMADLISELEPFTFLSNSDAHSLGKIGREYNRIRLNEPTFHELVMALERRDGRKVEVNYGLNPRLGKYHRTYCGQCGSLLDGHEIAEERCLHCGSRKMVRGVMERISGIADRERPIHPGHRPDYYHQIPLEYIPGLGKKKLDLLLQQFDTEMNILHRIGREQLAAKVGEEIAGYIAAAREGTLVLESGGGGKYGRVSRP